MQTSGRNFIIFTRHRRLTRLWQFFFTGWGLVMVAALVAGALFSRQLLWTPISAVNMTDIASNQFKMTNASFAGTDKNGNPFQIRAASGRQEYNQPDIVLLNDITGTITRNSDGKRTKSNIAARNATYNRKEKSITLTGNVKTNSDNGDNLLTNELVIKL